MTIEANESGISITGNHIRFARLVARKGALSLECKGLKGRGQTAYSICKQVYGFKGNKEKVLQQMKQLVEKCISREVSVDDLPDL